MPDAKGNYSLKEAAAKINVTAAWINRVQAQTKIGGQTGRQGRRTSFAEDTVETLRRVKVLRALNFNFKDIKQLYELEENIIKKEAEIAAEYALLSFTESKIPLILHTSYVIAIGKQFFTDAGKRSKELIYKDKRLKEYAAYISQLCSVANDAFMRKDDFITGVDDVNRISEGIFSKYPEQPKEDTA